jgi:hypothetical protein
MTDEEINEACHAEAEKDAASRFASQTINRALLPYVARDLNADDLVAARLALLKAADAIYIKLCEGFTE